MSTLPPHGEAVADVIVPVLNEAANLDELLRRLRALPVVVHPIFVDNGSTDRTLEILRGESDVELIEHGENLGYGASLRDGLLASRRDRVVIIDADLEYPPEEIPVVLEALEHAEVVYASRFLGRGASDVGMPRFRIIGNRVVSGIFNRLYGQRVTDLYTGFKGLRRSAFEGLRLERTGFEHVVELAARLARRGARITEIPMHYRLRRSGDSKMRHVSETLKFLWLVLRYRLDRAGADARRPDAARAR